MRELIEPERSIPIVDECDVLVVGGGPAGLIAAIAAARLGVRTTLVERYGFLGGMATAALVGPFAGVRHRYGGGRIVGGVPWEMILELERHDGALVRPVEYGVGRTTTASESSTGEGNADSQGNDPGAEKSARGDVPFDPETLKGVCESMAMDAGVNINFHRFFAGVITETSNISAVITESKSGRQAYTGRVVIDATGDADVAASAGVAFRKGRDHDGALQPMTLMFRLGAVDTDSLGEIDSAYVSSQIRSRAKELNAGGLLPRFGGPWTFWGSTFRPGEVMVNMVRLVGDATDADILSQSETVARAHVRQFVTFLRENFEAFRNCFLMDSGSQIGVRETRRIVGRYVLTGEDVIAGRTFEDSIALGGHVIDIHSPTGNAEQVRHRVAPYQIPYRCLLPTNVTNLLVAGRPISADHEAHASLRVQGTCMATGQAAGIAAATAIRNGVVAGDLPAIEIQRTLSAWGAPYEKGILD